MSPLDVTYSHGWELLPSSSELGRAISRKGSKGSAMFTTNSPYEHRWLLHPPPGARLIDTGAARWWVDPCGVVCNQSYIDGVVTAEHLRAGFRAALELTGGGRAPLAAEAGPLSSATREARDLLAGPETAAVFTAMAVVVTSPVARTVMNFFVRFSKPSVPVRVFTAPDQALDWARSYLEPRV